MDFQPEPSAKKYKVLMHEIESGNITIPKFQRDFVWSINQTAELLDSVIKGYPIGTFILWETTERMNQLRTVGNLSLKEADDGEKYNMCLMDSNALLLFMLHIEVRK